jgi:hypothetical protein
MVFVMEMEGASHAVQTETGLNNIYKFTHRQRMMHVNYEDQLLFKEILITVVYSEDHVMSTVHCVGKKESFSVSKRMVNIATAVLWKVGVI